jgi:hypothetical protein
MLGAPNQPLLVMLGVMSTTFASHIEDKQPTAANYVGGMSLVTASHIGQTSPTSVGRWRPAPNLFGGNSPTTTIHTRGFVNVEKPR